MRPALHIDAPPPEPPGPTVFDLLSDILADLQTLIRKEIALQTREIHDRIDGAASAIGQLIAVGAIVSLGGLLLALGLAFGIAQLFGWPPWAGLLTIGGALAIGGLAGLAVRRRGRRQDDR